MGLIRYAVVIKMGRILVDIGQILCDIRPLFQALLIENYHRHDFQTFQMFCENLSSVDNLSIMISPFVKLFIHSFELPIANIYLLFNVFMNIVIIHYYPREK